MADRLSDHTAASIHEMLADGEMSQAEIAECVGCTQPTVSRIQRGQWSPNQPPAKRPPPVASPPDLPLAELAGGGCKECKCGDYVKGGDCVRCLVAANVLAEQMADIEPEDEVEPAPCRVTA